MALHKHKDQELRKLNRYFTIAKVLLMITPLICYLYISLKSTMMGISFQDALTKDPQVIVIFLIAMINPYVAYITKLIQENLSQGNIKFACLNMILLLIGEILTMNIYYVLILLYVFYKAIRYYNISIKEALLKSTIKQAIYDGGGSLFVMLISCISLFANIKLM